MSPLISVVIPSYNHRTFIGEAIASAQSQSHRSIEIVVIDDGSSDGSFEYVRDEFGSALAHAEQRSNRGAHATINDAIAKSGGEWIAILNSDDVYARDRLAKLIDFAQRNNHDVVFSDVGFIDEKGPLRPTHKVVQSHGRATVNAERGTIEQALLRGNFALTTSNLMIRRTAFDAIGPFRAFRYCHDWDFLLRAIGRARIGWLREPLMNYRLHATNTIREPDRWRHLTENALVYACFLADGAAAPTPSLQSSDYVLESREFTPVVVSWLLGEVRRQGVIPVFRDLESGILHERVRAELEPRFAVDEAGMTVRDIQKKLGMGALKSTLTRLRNQLTRTG